MTRSIAVALRLKRGALLGERMVAENNAVMMYSPYLESGAAAAQ